jgi:hypothetical protein
MTIAIMQPTYMPWIGYFNLILNSDIFVFLDDVQFEKQSWQQKNRIILYKKEFTLTIPVLTKHRSEQAIFEVETDEKTNWRKKQLKTIYSAYEKHPHGTTIIGILERVINSATTNLCEINVSLIIQILDLLKVKKEIIFSSQMNIRGKRSDKIYSICKNLGASIYLSPIGSKGYIEDEGIFAKNRLPVVYQNYIPVEYPQKGIANFIPYMSIVDLLANVGSQDAQAYIEDGFKPTLLI